jgi:ABC-type bacteriocin/lantibiotic exporter with double-glycine peptidase domain
LSFPNHNPRQIEYIYQRGKTDCGVACFAMIAGFLYEDARRLFPKTISRGLFPEQLLEKLDDVGFDARETKSLPKKGIALVTVNWKKDDLGGHFVVWDSKRKQFLDPIFGVVDKEEMLKHADIEDIWKIVF